MSGVDEVASRGRDGGEVLEERGGQRVPGDDVVAGVDDERRDVGHVIEQVQHGRRHIRGRPDGRLRRDSGDLEEMSAFVRVEAQGPGQLSENPPGRTGSTDLFEPGVVLDRNVCQSRHFLAAQPGRTTGGVASRRSDIAA
jgi:hypothetical protein